MDRPLLAITAITFIVILGFGIPFGILCQVGVIPQATGYLRGGVIEIYDDGTIMLGGRRIDVPPEVLEQIEVGYSLSLIYEESTYGERVYYIVSFKPKNGDKFVFKFATEWVK